jgi:hypothetical protein
MPVRQPITFLSLASHFNVRVETVGMSPMLEFVGKAAGIFDACCIIVFVGMLATVSLQLWMSRRIKLPANHWALVPIGVLGGLITIRLLTWVAQWIWNLQP